MKEQIDQIRRILSEMEAETSIDSVPGLGRDLSALELPIIIQEIVDDLQPLLTPYEAAFYWYMFRHSIAENGISLVRVSTTELSTSVVKSTYTKADRKAKLSLFKVRRWLAALESIGAIRKEGEPNRKGTPYRVLIPDEIDVCRKYRAQRLKAKDRPSIASSDIDYYNVRENRIKIFERDEYKCHYCHKQLTRFTATLDHIEPVSERGDNSFDNLVTACLNCNSRKNRKPVGDFLVDQGQS